MSGENLNPIPRVPDWYRWRLQVKADQGIYHDTMVQNSIEHRKNSHLINHFSTSSGVSKVSQQMSKVSGQVSKCVSGASKWANGRASGLGLQSGFLIILDHSARSALEGVKLLPRKRDIERRGKERQIKKEEMKNKANQITLVSFVSF